MERLIEKLQTIPADFRYSDLKKIMSYYGYREYTQGKTSGSRVKFSHPVTQASILLHKPHPGDQMVKGAVRSVVDFFFLLGHI